MDEDLEKIKRFITKHHVMSLATRDSQELSICSLFYAYSKELNSFVVASSTDTTHIKHIQKNSQVSGNILLETKSVGKIQGLQFHATFSPLKNKELKNLYFKTFPYALALLPTLWQIKVQYFKFTDNTLGFGKKLTWGSLKTIN